MKKLLLISFALLMALAPIGCSAPATLPAQETENATHEPSLSPTQPTPATFTVSNLVVSPIAPDGVVNSSVTITNTGDLTGLYAVIYKLDGVIEDARQVTLDGHSSTKEFFSSVISPEDHAHLININGLEYLFLDKPVQATPIPFQDNRYTIRVTGNPLTETETEFSGSYMVVTSDGNATSRSVDGITPAEYRVKGMIVSCVFQNQNDYGLLKVEILYKGTVVNSSCTIAAYGVVSVATQ